MPVLKYQEHTELLKTVLSKMVSTNFSPIDTEVALREQRIKITPLIQKVLLDAGYQSVKIGSLGVSHQKTWVHGLQLSVIPEPPRKSANQVWRGYEMQVNAQGPINANVIA